MGLWCRKSYGLYSYIGFLLAYKGYIGVDRVDRGIICCR